MSAVTAFNSTRQGNLTPLKALSPVTKGSFHKISIYWVSQKAYAFNGKIFVCCVPRRIDLLSMDSKISCFNDLLSIGLTSGTSSSDLTVVETIDREIRFSDKDGLHLNKEKGCTALAGSILKCLYSVLRPLCKKDKRRPYPNDIRGSRKSGFRSKRKHTVNNSRQITFVSLILNLGLL